MEEFEHAFQESLKRNAIANAVIVGNCGGQRYERAFGKVSLEPDAAGIDLSAVFPVFSCTKLFTAVAALQCVSRGLVTLDEPIARVLPEYANPTIVTSISANGQPVTMVATKPVTLRHMLTHTSGMGYEMTSPLLKRWRKAQPLDMRPGRRRGDILKEYNSPLTFEPGALGKWQYSSGFDWAGKLVERFNDGAKLGDYMQIHIFEPLGITSATFRPLQHPEIMAKMCSRVQRKPDGTLKMDSTAAYPLMTSVDDIGGGGLYISAKDFNAVLESLLNDDEKLLSHEMVEELFRPQLPDLQGFQDTFSDLRISKLIAEGLPGGSKSIKWNCSIAGLVAVDGVAGVAGKGTSWWDGFGNSVWFVDRKRKTCGFYGTYIIPYDDETSGELFKKFQKGLYEAAA